MRLFLIVLLGIVSAWLYCAADAEALGGIGMVVKQLFNLG